MSMAEEPGRYPCPCCGYGVFDEAPGSFAIRPICFWEDDQVQLRFAGSGGGANSVSLLEGQRNYRALGACEARFITLVRRPTGQDQRDPGWRSLALSSDTLDAPDAVMHATQDYPEDHATPYYWRR